MTTEAIELASDVDPTTAVARLALINEAFDRGEAGHAQVDAVEREVSYAAREARKAQSLAEQAQKAREAAEDVQNASELQALNQVRAQVPHELLGHIRAVQSLHVEVSQRTAVIFSVLDKDSSAVAQINALAVALGLRPSAKALNPELFRMAVGILLAGPRSRPNPTCSRGAALPMDRLLAELNRETPPLSPAEKAAVCRLALAEYELATDGASVAGWMSEVFPPPSFLNGTPSAAKFKQAQALLAALLQHGDQK
jgi:hypothetical protein